MLWSLSRSDRGTNLCRAPSLGVRFTGTTSLLNVVSVSARPSCLAVACQNSFAGWTAMSLASVCGVASVPSASKTGSLSSSSELPVPSVGSRDRSLAP